MDILALLQEINVDLVAALNENRYLFTTEADLQGFVYMQLMKQKARFTKFKDSESRSVFPIHLEYPRLYQKKNSFGSYGRYDIAILGSNDGVFLNDDFDQKHVDTAFELKLYWDDAPQVIKKSILSELPAFNNGGKQYLPKSGIILSVNMAKTESSIMDIETWVSDLKDIIIKKKKTNGYNFCDLFLFHLECSREGEIPDALILKIH